MQERIYLLDLTELKEEQTGAFLQREVRKVLDEERLGKALRIHNSAAQAASLGAGLLLQMAVAEREFPAAFFRCFGVRELLDRLKETAGEQIPIPLVYRYGEQGKPYLRDIPIQFSLSHSGRFVLCAASEREIGADIQQMRSLSSLRVAERFFAPEELAEIRREEKHARQEQAFYRLWVRKEAYGKLTGEGIVAVAGLNMNDLETKLCWERCPEVDGYQLAVCRYREDG